MQRKWFIVLILSAVAGFSVFLFLLISAYNLFKGDAYYQSVAAVQSHPEVIEKLGSPIEPGWFFGGNYLYSYIFMHYDISGSKDNGKVYLQASKENEAWVLESVWVMPDNADEFIIVLEQPPIPSSGGCKAPEDFNAEALPEEDMEGIYVEHEET